MIADASDDRVGMRVLARAWLADLGRELSEMHIRGVERLAALASVSLTRRSGAGWRLWIPTTNATVWPARPLARERSRLFDQQAEAYDRFRPTYPDAVIDELLGPVPAGLDVLDVGCGTGIASRQMAQRGAKVLGVELAPRMAEIARGHGIDVEIAAFEGWDAAGRTFDRVTSAQAWHWLDLPIATAQGGLCAAAGRQALSDLERRVSAR